MILEPEAVADLLGGLAFALNARSADEGRSFLSKPGGGTRLGEKLFADGVTLKLRPVRPPKSRQPLDRRRPGRRRRAVASASAASAAAEGAACRPGGRPGSRTAWSRPSPSTATGRPKTKVEPLPFSGSLVMDGSKKSLEELIAETERALLVTRFWYIRTSSTRRNAMATGLTRDGVWLVEKGKIVHPVNNFRFNESPVNLLKNLEATSMPPIPAGNMIVPAIRARRISSSPPRATPCEAPKRCLVGWALTQLREGSLDLDPAYQATRLPGCVLDFAEIRPERRFEGGACC